MLPLHRSLPFQLNSSTDSATPQDSTHQKNIGLLQFASEAIINQNCQRLETRDGVYHSVSRGIPKGCPLSPFIAALYLKPLVEAMAKHGFYVRFMDDWLILARTRHQLRRIIKSTHKILGAVDNRSPSRARTMFHGLSAESMDPADKPWEVEGGMICQQTLESLKLKMHPDKTFFGCIKKGLDFLGVYFCDSPRISNKSLENHHFKLAQPYAQGASIPCTGRYIERWTFWCKSQLDNCRNLTFPFAFLA